MRARYERVVHESSHGIDLAPMLDFTVNLLIFFIVTAVCVKEFAISVRRPTGADAASSLAANIEVRDDGEVVVDGRVIDLRSVRANVEHMVADDRSSVFVVAHENAPTGVVVAVVDQVHLGGIYDITFGTAQ
jgi:biopolymer transport protein ExbD